MSATTSLELWQTEWCPASRRVRQRLTELGLTYLTHQVPVPRDARRELMQATGGEQIPVLVADGEPVHGEPAILAFLDAAFDEPPGASEHRARAIRARQKELEAECPKLTAATP